MTDDEVRIVRLEEAMNEVRRALREALEMASRALAMSAATSYGGGGGSGLGRFMVADGVITAQAGGVLGAGSAFAAPAPSGTISAGSVSQPVANLLVKQIKTGALCLAISTADQEVIIAVGDPCNDLETPP